jgi:hypothetical protein
VAGEGGVLLPFTQPPHTHLFFLSGGEKLYTHNAMQTYTPGSNKVGCHAGPAVELMQQLHGSTEP